MRTHSESQVPVVPHKPQAIFRDKLRVCRVFQKIENLLQAVCKARILTFSVYQPMPKHGQPLVHGLECDDTPTPSKSPACRPLYVPATAFAKDTNAANASRARVPIRPRRIRAPRGPAYQAMAVLLCGLLDRALPEKYRRAEKCSSVSL